MSSIAHNAIYSMRSRLSSFIYNYSWPNYVFLIDGWIAKASMAVPIIGYLVIFNDVVAQHLTFQILTSDSPPLALVSSSARLKLIFYGLFALGTANLIYRVRRPYVMSLGPSQKEFTTSALEYFNASDYRRINSSIRGSDLDPYTTEGKYYDSEFDAFIEEATGSSSTSKEADPRKANWASAKSKYESLLRSMLTEHYFRNTITRRKSLSAALVLALLGYLMLAIPSLDLVLRVSSLTLSGLF